MARDEEAQAREDTATRAVKRAAAARASEPSFGDAYKAARRAWEQGKGDPTFSFNGSSYSVQNREEAARNKAMRESPTRGRGTNRAEAPDNSRAEAPDNSRAGATKAMADRAAADAQSRRAASESRAQAARESDAEIKRESRGSTPPKPRSIYDGLDVGKVAGAAATIASVVPAVRAVRAGVEAVKSARAASQGAKVVRDPRTREPMELPAPSKEIVRDSDRVGFKNGGLVRLGKLKSHGKAC